MNGLKDFSDTLMIGDNVSFNIGVSATRTKIVGTVDYLDHENIEVDGAWYKFDEIDPETFEVLEFNPDDEYSPAKYGRSFWQRVRDWFAGY